MAKNYRVEPRDVGHIGRSLLWNKEIFFSLFLVLEPPFLLLSDPSRRCWGREGHRSQRGEPDPTTLRRSSRENAKSLFSPPAFTARILNCYKEVCQEFSCLPCRVGEDEDKKKLLSAKTFLLLGIEWKRTRQSDGREVWSHFHQQSHSRRQRNRQGGEV